MKQGPHVLCPQCGWAPGDATITHWRRDCSEITGAIRGWATSNAFSVSIVTRFIDASWKRILIGYVDSRGDSNFYGVSSGDHRWRAALCHARIPCISTGALFTRPWLADLISDVQARADDSVEQHLLDDLLPIWAANHVDPVTKYWQENWP